MEKETLAYEMAKQLHEQYAANDNAMASNMIAFLTAIAFIFAGFGYVYAQPYLSDSLEGCENYPCLLFSAFVVSCTILMLMSLLCVKFGYSTRRDHVVITRLRKTYAKEEFEMWFNGKFNGCGKHIYDYLPDYYMIMFVFIQIFIIFLTIGCYINIQMQNQCRTGIILVAIVSMVINLLSISCYCRKYKRFQTDEEKKARNHIKEEL